jgi:hypothetical protein
MKSRKHDKKVRIEKPPAPAPAFVSVPYDYAVTVQVSFEVFNPRDCDTAREELSHDKK